MPIDERSLPELRTQELIERASAGNQTAWTEIYARYRRALEPIVRAKLRTCPKSHLEADDLLQSAFLAAWQRLSKFEYQGEGSLLRWITAVTLNTLTDRLRARPTRDEPRPIGFESETSVGPDPGASPHGAAEAAEYRLRLLESVAELDRPEQEVLVARLLEELSWPQIAKRLATPEGTLRRRLHMAFRKLSQRLARWEPE